MTGRELIFTFQLCYNFSARLVILKCDVGKDNFYTGGQMSAFLTSASCEAILTQVDASILSSSHCLHFTKILKGCGH